MTGPTLGWWMLRCESCRGIAYASDDAPPDRGHQTVITEMATARCPRGGTEGGCPHTPDRLDDALARRPARIVARIRDSRGRADRAADTVAELAASLPQVVVVPLPMLLIGTRSVDVTWPSPFPRVPMVQVTLELPMLMVGNIRAAVAGGSRTVTGCTIVIDTAIIVPAGQGWLHMTATP